MDHFMGLFLATTLLIGIWSGHILVRKIEFSAFDLRVPIVAFCTIGIILVTLSLVNRSNLLSGVFGILGIIFFWNGIESHHQENRVKRGHAPANPLNPRHQRILMNFPSATTVNLLKHNHSITGEELP